MQKYLIAFVVSICLCVYANAQTQVTLSIGTGNDDLREGSKINISVIYYNPVRATVIKEIAEGRRFPDRTNFTASISLPAGVPASSIQEIQLEYIPDPANFPKESDKWWFVRFLAVYTNGTTTITLFENNSVNKKFEDRGTWSTGVLSSFSTPIAVRKIVVTNADTRQPAVGAQVFLKLTPLSAWITLGSTNTTGEIVFTQNITSSSVIVARHRIHEQNYYRSYHNWNSTQNWNYRVYLTNLDVTSNGTLRPDVSGLGTNRVDVRIKRSNTLIGCNLLASAEWDLSTTEVNELRAKLKAASDFLFNATDGQFFFEQITIYDRGFRWDDSDYRIYASTTLRANVPYPPGAFLGQDVWGSCMKMSRTNNSNVYAHEFGHYGLVVRDEYDDNNASIMCTSSILSAGSAFAAGTASASCMMFHQDLGSKLCSTHPLNPHLDGSRQGSQSCWDKIKSRYNNSSNWLITSPVDKNAIVPALMMADGSNMNTLPFISTAFNEQSQDAGGAGVIRTHNIRTETATGAVPLEGVEINTLTPSFSFLGTTNNTGVLAATGLRSETEVLAMHYSGVGALANVNPVTSVQTIIPLDITINGGSSSAPTNNQTIRNARADALVEISTTPTGDLMMAVKGSKKLKAPPVISFIKEGVVPAGTIKATASNIQDSYMYLLSLSKAYEEGVLIIKGEYEDGTLLRQTVSLATAKNCPEEIFAFNGLVSINKGGKVVSKGRVLLYSIRQQIDKLPKGTVPVGLPFILRTFNADFYSGKPILEVRLPQAPKGGVLQSVKTNSIKVYKYDSVKNNWYPQHGFILNNLVAVYAGALSSDGLYVIVTEK
jgi:hypothetical protein